MVLSTFPGRHSTNNVGSHAHRQFRVKSALKHKFVSMTCTAPCEATYTLTSESLYDASCLFADGQVSNCIASHQKPEC